MSNKVFNLEEKMLEVEHRISSLEKWQGRNLEAKLSESQWTQAKDVSPSVTMYRDKFQGKGNESNLDILQLQTEKEKLSTENDILKAQIVKLQYRIKHLTRSFDEAEAMSQSI